MFFDVELQYQVVCRRRCFLRWRAVCERNQRQSCCVKHPNSIRQRWKVRSEEHEWERNGERVKPTISVINKIKQKWQDNILKSIYFFFCSLLLEYKNQLHPAELLSINCNHIYRYRYNYSIRSIFVGLVIGRSYSKSRNRLVAFVRQSPRQ